MYALCKNAYGLVHARLCNGAEASLPWKLLRTDLESCASIVQAFFCLPLLPPLLLSRPNPLPDSVRSRNLSRSKSTLAHDEVATAVSHKHHSIMQASSSLSESHSRLATGVTSSRILFSQFFLASFLASTFQEHTKVQYHLMGRSTDWRQREC